MNAQLHRTAQRQRETTSAAQAQEQAAGRICSVFGAGLEYLSTFRRFKIMLTVSRSTKAEPQVLSQALDELSHLVLSGREIEYSDAVQSWYRRGYRCADVPAPDDTDRTLLALKACIVERLVEVLNSPPHGDNQTVPDWCARMPGVNQPTPLQSTRLLEGETFNNIFARRNLLVTKNFMYFV